MLNCECLTINVWDLAALWCITISYGSLLYFVHFSPSSPQTSALSRQLVVNITHFQGKVYTDSPCSDTIGQNSTFLNISMAFGMLFLAWKERGVNMISNLSRSGTEIQRPHPKKPTFTNTIQESTDENIQIASICRAI